jgi:hypothetical protein
MNVLICGYGNIGKKHFKSIKKNTKINKIYIYDKFIIRRNIFNNINTIKKKIHLVIIATTSKRRLNLIKEINYKFNPKFWIIEKFLETNLINVKKVKSELKNKIAYINLPKRGMSVYKKIKNIFKEKKNINIMMSGKNWNMASNTVHFIDLIKWMFNAKLLKIKFDEIKKIKSKREGYLEIMGATYLLFNKNIKLRLENNLSSSERIIHFSSKSKNIFYNFNNSYLITNKKKIYIREEYISEFTNMVINDILEYGKSKKLPSLNSHIKDCILFIKKLKKKLKIKKELNIT